ncbi:hypothetical protein HMPREF0663_11249 [Hoylesella oralis ATCC 33269]|uniref:Uncharacterized protein n=1 Tax=Hoylesella oralis ATCC 33269 TaxID=873533 RepID=E7RPZ8_9BACT|nr:hypothetical protein HMPREF0663_11249 [Hoylesella oralis ATCC 33269]
MFIGLCQIFLRPVLFTVLLFYLFTFRFTIKQICFRYKKISEYAL